MTGVVLENGDEIDADAVVAAIVPAETFVKLVDPIDLPPTFLERVRHIRARGVTAKINLALTGHPCSPSWMAIRCRCGDDCSSRPMSIISRARSMRPSTGRCPPSRGSKSSMPTMTDPSLAPEGQHVMSIYAQFAPRHLRGANWTDRRDALLESVLRVLDPHAPALRKLIAAVDVLTPEDIETGLGPAGRTHLSWRADARSIVGGASAPGLGAVPHADRRPVSRGRRRAPGRRTHRPARVARRQGCTRVVNGAMGQWGNADYGRVLTAFPQSQHCPIASLPHCLITGLPEAGPESQPAR